MIITKLIGGLGNQMFQYAAGKRTAYINKTELKLDTSWFKNPEGAIKRDYLLNIFNIKENFATKEEINKLKSKNQHILALLYKRIFRFTEVYYKQSYIKQRYFHFDPNILKISTNTYLDGSWQSEKYFSDIKDIIKQEFIFKNEPDKKNKQLIDKISHTSSVSIHIRRGDYVTDKKTNQFHGICDLNYYHSAIKYIISKIKKPFFFVFSDDLLWTRKNLHLKFPCIYVDHNTGKKDYEDMRLMSECKHNIIANSTFSWWGAWLNRNPKKIVITPKEWFKEETFNPKDLIPKLWLKF